MLDNWKIKLSGVYLQHYETFFLQKFPGCVILDIVFPLLILMKALIFWDVNNAFVNLQIIPVWNPQLSPLNWSEKNNMIIPQKKSM